MKIRITWEVEQELEVPDKFKALTQYSNMQLERELFEKYINPQAETIDSSELEVIFIEKVPRGKEENVIYEL